MRSCWQFKVKQGDRVLLRKRELEDKLDVPYEGPYRVVDVLNDGTRVRLHRCRRARIGIIHEAVGTELFDADTCRRGRAQVIGTWRSPRPCTAARRPC